MANQKTLSEQFFATRETDFDEAFWNRFLGELTARLKEFENIKIAWESLSQDALEVALERINEVLGPAAERIQNIAALGFLSVESKSSRTLAVDVVSFTAEAGDQLDLFVPTPFVAVTRATNPFDFAIGRVIYFNRDDRIIDIDIVYFEGDPGPHNDWTIAAVAGQALAQTNLLNHTVDAKEETLTARTETLEARDEVETMKTTVEGLHTDFREAVAPSGAVPPTAPHYGQFWYDGELVRVYDGSGWVPAVTASIGGIRTEEGTFGASPSGNITVGGGFSFAMVWLNGLLLKEGTDYTASTPLITISGAAEGDEYMVWAYQANDPTDYYTKEETNTQFATKAEAVRVNAAQAFTEAQRGQARANMGAGILAGFRNKIINGNFPIWQRGISQTSSGYGSDDRWKNVNSGSTKNHSRQSFALGQTDVPGNPQFFSRTVVTSVAGASNFVAKQHLIEDVRTFAGKTATLTFYAKADAPKNIAVEFVQNFGTGGSPSAAVSGIGSQLVALTTSWKRFDVVVNIPSIAGKTLGSNTNDSLNLNFWYDAGSNFNANTANLGQQSGTFDIVHISLVEGDATAEDDPFSPRHIQQEADLCYRYYYQTTIGLLAYADTTIVGTSADLRTKYATMWLPIAMRAQPTIAVTAGWGAVGTNRYIQASIAVRQDTGAVCSAWTADAEL